MSKKFIQRLGLKDKLLAIIVPLMVLAAWQGAVSQKLCSDLILTPPLTLLNTLVELAQSGDLTLNILASLKRVMIGFLLGGTSGFVLGILMALSPFLNRIFGPLIKALQQVPEFAWMPLIIMFLGIDESAKYFFVAIGAFYPMVLNTYQGVSGVPEKYHELARVFDYKSFRYLFKVIIPSALPSIITGIRLSLGLSWMFVVGAELFGSDSGVGYLMTWGRAVFQIDLVMAGLVLVGVIGFAMNLLLEIAEKRFLLWREPVDGRPV